MNLIERYTFDQAIDPDWNAVEAARTTESNAVIEDGSLSLWTRPYTGTRKGDPWRGGAIVREAPFTYGKVAVDLRVDPGVNTKALLMLIFPQALYANDQEIDFLEQGGGTNWNRQRANFNAHYGPRDENKAVRRYVMADLTQWSTIVCDWQPATITYRHRPLGDVSQEQKVVIDNPGITEELKIHLANWPHYSKEGGPWPVAESRMQVKEVRMFQ